MAELARQTRADADWLLDYLFAEWEDLTNIAHEWPTWDKIERIHALIDWPVVESNLRRLNDLVVQSALTPAQDARYTALQALIATYRPLLRQLMDGVTSTAGRNGEPPSASDR